MLKIAEGPYQHLRRHAEEDYPHESCGVLLGRSDGAVREVVRVARCSNTRADAPRNRYHIDPGELVRVEREGRARGEDIVGFYHSHPDHPALPSGTDLAEAHWLGCSYVITAVRQGQAEATRSFVLEGDGEGEKRFSEEDLVHHPGKDGR
ncbi:MAG TPA: M67 family metallopeptidase [Anaeromyxobacteraceae bacterium]|nr:M67 family metallopeptidase [Anaeromyxobacteraceae bacterium]